MKKLMMTMVALLTMTAAVAQNNESAERKAPKQPTPEEVTAQMAETLKLTDEQKSKVLTLNKEYKDVLGGPGRHHGPRGPRPGGARPGKPDTDGQTGATPQQAEGKNEKKGQQRPERPQLTDEQKAELKARMAKRQEYTAKLKKILTAEQYENLQKQGPRRGGKDGQHRKPGKGKKAAKN